MVLTAQRQGYQVTHTSDHVQLFLEVISVDENFTLEDYTFSLDGVCKYFSILVF